ncbi:hypothetical protein REPUB_Repub07fG0216700 [Reevesia pubescens]
MIIDQFVCCPSHFKRSHAKWILISSYKIYPLIKPKKNLRLIPKLQLPLIKASTMALRRLSSSPLFRNLLVNRNFSSKFAPSMARSFSYNIPVTNPDEELGCINTYGGSMNRTVEFNIRHGAFDQIVEHPWQLEGPKGTYEAKKVEEGLFVRVDMPGNNKNEVQLWKDNDRVFIKGEGRKKSDHESSGRTYSGSVDVCSNFFDLNKIKASIQNGVFRMLIPKKESEVRKNPNQIRFDKDN